MRRAQHLRRADVDVDGDRRDGVGDGVDDRKALRPVHGRGYEPLRSTNFKG